MPSSVVCLGLRPNRFVEADHDVLGAVDVAGGAGAHDAGVLALRLEGEEGVERRHPVHAGVRDAERVADVVERVGSSRNPKASWAAWSASISAAGRSPMRRIRVSTIFQRLSSLGGAGLVYRAGIPTLRCDGRIEHSGRGADRRPATRWHAIADLGRRSARTVPAILRARWVTFRGRPSRVPGLRRRGPGAARSRVPGPLARQGRGGGPEWRTAPIPARRRLLSEAPTRRGFIRKGSSGEAASGSHGSSRGRPGHHPHRGRMGDRHRVRAARCRVSGLGEVRLTTARVRVMVRSAPRSWRGERTRPLCRSSSGLAVAIARLAPGRDRAPAVAPRSWWWRPRQESNLRPTA